MNLEKNFPDLINDMENIHGSFVYTSMKEQFQFIILENIGWHTLKNKNKKFER